MRPSHKSNAQPESRQELGSLELSEMLGPVGYFLRLLWSLLTGLLASSIHLAETFSRLYPWALTTGFGIIVLFVLPVLILTGQDHSGDPLPKAAHV